MVMNNTTKLSGRRIVVWPGRSVRYRCTVAWLMPPAVNTLELSSFREGPTPRRRTAGVAAQSVQPSLGGGD